MKVLFFADCWDNLWRRRQQLAWHLAEASVAEHVVYIERPLPSSSLVKFLLRRADRDGTDRWRRVLSNHSWVMSVKETLSVLTTFAPMPLTGLAPVFRISEKARDRWLLRYLDSRFDTRNPPLVWVSHPQLSVEVIQALERDLLWYDCTEDFAAWPGLPKCVREQIVTTDRWLTEHADVITCVSRTLYEEKRQVNLNTHWLPNAVDAELFLRPAGEYPVPTELQNVPRPVLAFVGGLGEWPHDWDLLDQVATLRPQWTTLLIGSLRVGQKVRRMLAGHSNIVCVGQKPYRDLPPYLVHSDVCFQFYRQGRGNDTRNSQKLFLYLAAGKPVISTPSADVTAYESFASIVDSACGFVREVERCLAVNNPLLAERGRAFARGNSWTTRAKAILDILRDLGRAT